jgi:hypothetical protein
MKLQPPFVLCLLSLSAMAACRGHAGGSGADGGLDGSMPDAGPLPPAELQGAVIDGDAAAVAGMTVLVYRVEGATLEHGPDGIIRAPTVLVTGVDGTWSTGPVEPGTYHVRVQPADLLWPAPTGAPDSDMTDFSDIDTSAEWVVGGDVVGAADHVTLTRGDESTFMRYVEPLEPPVAIEVTMRVTQQTWESIREGFRLSALDVCDEELPMGVLSSMDMQLYRALAAGDAGAAKSGALERCGGTSTRYQRRPGAPAMTGFETMRLEVVHGSFIGETGLDEPFVGLAAGSSYELDLPGRYTDGNGGDVEDPTIFEVSSIRIFGASFGRTVEAEAGSTVPVDPFVVGLPGI